MPVLGIVHGADPQQTLAGLALPPRLPGDVNVNGIGCDVFPNVWSVTGDKTTRYDPTRGKDRRNGVGSTFKAPESMFTAVVTAGRAEVQTIIT